ncbi:FGGY carbohydrate kinase domain-containing protein [Culex quinquefasciatus]|uniref:FGGY carbohydrate kinase domain-containing protein n=1 Tax=Culex quinquefasciatus TaxID=7176 RepID=UPI0018E2CE54|nr:FGGY carbohydrate kinase domain-containing protein [Culex quinquefasciatus]
MSQLKCVIGVDVGTGSARAALVTSTGQLLKSCVKATQTWNPLPDLYEQSSDNIWSAVCECVRTVAAVVPKEQIKGIGFDATCSLVALDKGGQPLSVSSTGRAEQNIILWMDHRAQAEADLINATKHELLNYVGGSVSLEMEMPKLMWLKKNRQLTWSNAGAFFDLPDFLTYKATGSSSRSICSAVCKWNYDAMKSSWSVEFLDKIGLSELAENGFHLIGEKLNSPGDQIANGLSQEAAALMGLLPGTAVATSMIDAHAGALALLGCRNPDSQLADTLTSKLAIICGTSSCHMSLTEGPVMAPGIWGPYKNAIIPNLYLNEAGQSATGVLMDFILQTHPCYAELLQEHGSNGKIYAVLNDVLRELTDRKGLQSVHRLTTTLHVWPDFHGNRSPLADPNLKGMICGLTMNKTVENLALIYLALMQALAYGTRHILDVLARSGREPIRSILLCGGLSKNPLLVQTHADICSTPVLLPHEAEAVLLGSAMMGACAAGIYTDLKTAAAEMAGPAEIVKPDLSDENRDYHERKYRVFLRMVGDQRAYQQIMIE